MKKEGIMRINSYSKFFAKVAEIMNTSIKAVKQFEGRYKVELANDIFLNVYRGVSGTLFIHDHRGLTDITSCYDFEYLRISAISAKEAIEHFKIQFGKQQNRIGRKKYIYWNVEQIPESED